MEEDLKILKAEYLSNHLLDPTQILNLYLDYQKKVLQILEMKTTSNGRQPQNIKRAISQQPLHCMDYGNLKENSEKISRVALLRLACFVVIIYTTSSVHMQEYTEY
jgi:hypothetical protein